MDKMIPWNRIVEYVRSGRKDVDNELESWINESQEHKDLFNELLVVHELNDKKPEPFSPDTKKAWKTIIERVNTSTIRPGSGSIMLKIAAAIILLMLGFSISLLIDRKIEDSNSLTRIQAPNGQKAHVMLPDSSTVILNGGTTLVYANNFLSDRKVELSGEALFDVKKSEGKHFIVQTDHIDVDVYGTLFNVKAYGKDAEIEIALVEGKIGLSQNGQTISDLSPGQAAIYNKASNSIMRKHENMSKIIAWSNDQLIFEDMTFQEIATYLERWYGVEIELQESLKKQHRYTFNVKTESLRELLNLISLITPIDYKIDGKNVKILKKI
jgi:ferric-dicitrate binding protein FerR (iron transport regulator)